MKLKGKVHKYGANVDTDAIVPARHLNLSEAADLAKHCMEDLDADFVKKVRPGDIIVAGTNFGSGSSREHAPLAIKGCGISAVVAKSFARIFYRNAMNIGLPIVECPEAVDGTRPGEILEIDLDSGVITNVTRKRTYRSKPFPPFMVELIRDGGLIEHTKKRLAKTKRRASR
ncbi:MAG: 3-isopropylmalate dehydratase small subunit [Dehalococcoidia bacterium]|nr:3-isopropylmalate dehydratase small subunit [Dehalococcoidia bacterium]